MSSSPLKVLRPRLLAAVLGANMQGMWQTTSNGPRVSTAGQPRRRRTHRHRNVETPPVVEPGSLPHRYIAMLQRHHSAHSLRKTPSLHRLPVVDSPQRRTNQARTPSRARKGGADSARGNRSGSSASRSDRQRLPEPRRHGLPRQREWAPVLRVSYQQRYEEAQLQASGPAADA